MVGKETSVTNACGNLGFIVSITSPCVSAHKLVCSVFPGSDIVLILFHCIAAFSEQLLRIMYNIMGIFNMF